MTKGIMGIMQAVIRCPSLNQPTKKPKVFRKIMSIKRMMVWYKIWVNTVSGSLQTYPSPGEQ